MDLLAFQSNCLFIFTYYIIFILFLYYFLFIALLNYLLFIIFLNHFSFIIFFYPLIIIIFINYLFLINSNSLALIIDCLIPIPFQFFDYYSLNLHFFQSVIKNLQQVNKQNSLKCCLYLWTHAYHFIHYFKFFMLLAILLPQKKIFQVIQSYYQQEFFHFKHLSILINVFNYQCWFHLVSSSFESFLCY